MMVTIGKWQPVIAKMSVVVLMAAFVQPAASQDDGGGFSDVERLAKGYKISIVAAEGPFSVKCKTGLIEGTNAEVEQLYLYTRLFVPEFSIYPRTLIKNTKLQRVVFCDQLAFAGQRRAAIPDFEHDVLYLDVARGAHSKPYQLAVIHHEFFHMIDYRDDGNVYQDERWALLNPESFKYGGGGRTVQDLQESSLFTTETPGFLTRYATTGVEEDKAELFSHLIVNNAYVEARAKEDVVIAAKVQRMKELLARFCKEMNNDFWRNVRKIQRFEGEEPKL